MVRFYSQRWLNRIEKWQCVLKCITPSITIAQGLAKLVFNRPHSIQITGFAQNYKSYITKKNWDFIIFIKHTVYVTVAYLVCLPVYVKQYNQGQYV